MINNVVLDTNVLVSGLLSAFGNPGKIINALREGSFTPYYNDEILAEYRDVLFRDRLGLRAEDVDNLLDEISKIGFNLMPERSDTSLPDEDDRIFYDTAKAAGAHLVTGNLKHYPTDPLTVSSADFVKLL